MSLTESVLAAKPRAAFAERRKSIARAVGIAVVAFVLFSSLVAPSFGKKQTIGPTGSSYTTTGTGVAALAELATSFKRRVIRYPHDLSELGTLAKHPIEANSSLVVLNADLDAAAAKGVEQFVRDGGSVIGTVRSPGDWMGQIAEVQSLVDSVVGTPVLVIASASVAQGQAVDAFTPAENALAENALSLRVLGGAHFSENVNVPNGGVILARTEEGPIAVRVPVDLGNIVLLADSSMLSNDLLDQAGNAAFAISVLGPPEAPIVFAEQPHGFGSDLTPSGLPENVRWFLGGLVVATLVMMWSKSRRNGPPESPVRPVAPARSQYLLSMAAEIDRLENDHRFWRKGRRSTPVLPDVPGAPGGPGLRDEPKRV